MTDSLTIYKLIVLYVLGKVPFSLTNAQLSEFILGREYMSYFSLQTVLSELAESGHIHVETMSNSSYYSLTPVGEEAVLYFKNRIPLSFRDEIDRYMKDNQVKLRDEASVQADYYKNTAGEYSVHCVVKEKYANLIDLTISMPTEAQAKAACLNWNKQCQPIYEFIMKKLL